MTCQDFSTLYSAQIDGCAEEHEQLALQKHLRECGACRRRAAEMRHLVSDLKGLSESCVWDTQKARFEMAAQIQFALHREARLQSSYARERADLLDIWRTRLFSQSIGAMVSISLFFLVFLGVFRPAYRALMMPASSQLRPPAPPIFSPSGELLNIGASLSADSEVMARVKVHQDGRASVNQIVATPSDKSMLIRISSVITQQASFQPTGPDKNTSSEAVVIFSKVNISG